MKIRANFSTVLTVVLLLTAETANCLQQPANAQPSHSIPSASPTPEPPQWTDLVRKTVVYIKTYFSDNGTQKEASGTGFFVYYPDARLGKDKVFGYLVTNRHMADPSVTINHPIQTLGHTLLANRVTQSGETSPSLVSFPITTKQWYFPDDRSVDLAVMPLNLDPSKIDFAPISFDMLATEDSIKKEKIATGDSVVFAGFFAQFPGQQKIEPVLREGFLAMMPSEPIPTTLNLPGKLYLADMHSFHGNSGSPVFVNLAGYRNGNIATGVRLLLLGILSGYMYESADFKLETATSYIGSVGANSGITTIVPAEELYKLLNSVPLSQQRDNVVRSMQAH